MSDESVFQNRLDELERSNERLELENALLESCAIRSSVNVDRADDGLTLPLQVLTDLCKQEIQNLRDIVASSKGLSEASEEGIRLQIDLADDAIGLINLDSFDFKKDVLLGAQHPSTRKLISEKVLRFFDKHLLEKDADVQEVNSKSEELKLKITRAEKKLKSKASGDIQYIDFHQLQIESQQLTKQSKTAKDDLDAMRAAARKSQEDLVHARNNLNLIEAEVKALTGEIAKVQDMLVDTKTRIAKASSERDAAAKMAEAVDHENRQKELKHEERLNAMTLIEQQVEIQDLQRLVKNLQRKLEIRKGQ